MKIRRCCKLVANTAVSFAASLIFSFAAAQTPDIENAAATAGQASEPVADASAVVVESSTVESPAAAAVPTAEQVVDAPTELVEVVSVDSPAAAAAEIPDPALSESPEVVPLPEPQKPAKPRYNRDDVLWIQQRLEELGYYTGPVDGAFGRGTREAIKAYQVDQEIEQDGRPTAELRDFMWRNGG